MWFFLNNSKTDEDQDGEGSNALSKPKKNFRKRHHKNAEIDLIESIPLKFRKFNSRIKCKSSTSKHVKQFCKRVQILPYEILQLEEVVSSANPLKIKLFTLSKEHLGYPSDLRSNFLFDHHTFFLQIHHSHLSLNDNDVLEKGNNTYYISSRIVTTIEVDFLTHELSESFVNFQNCKD